MTQTVDFYFDFMSPFAYLAHCRLARLPALYGCRIAYHPVDLGRLKRAIGNTGPSNRELPVKLRYLVSDLKRWADRYGVPLGFIGNVNTAGLNRGLFFARSRAQQADYVARAFARTWGESGAPDDPALLRALAVEMGWDPQEFADFLASGAATAAYEESCAQAIDRGVFGVPTMLLGDLMWWGNDRLFLLEEHLAGALPVTASAC